MNQISVSFYENLAGASDAWPAVLAPSALTFSPANLKW